MSLRWTDMIGWGDVLFALMTALFALGLGVTVALLLVTVLDRHDEKESDGLSNS